MHTKTLLDVASNATDWRNTRFSQGSEWHIPLSVKFSVQTCLWYNIVSQTPDVFVEDMVQSHV